MPCTILNDVGGVKGLHVALDVFTEETERRLFKSGIHGRRSELDCHNWIESNGKSGHSHGPILDDDAYRLCNAVRDCGLFPGFITPDCCLSWSYAGPTAPGGGAAFQLHFDSRCAFIETGSRRVPRRTCQPSDPKHPFSSRACDGMNSPILLSRADSIGETVVGVNLGHGCVMEFQPDNRDRALLQQGPPPLPPAHAAAGLHVEQRTFETDNFKLRVPLPRRSIYVMSGESRWRWKHGIAKLSPKNLCDFPPPPTWNPYGLRRSLTLRATKAFSDVTLERMLQRRPDDASLQARIAAQSKFPAQRPHVYKKLSKEETAALRAEAREMLRLLDHAPSHLRFRPQDVHYVSPPEAHAAGSGGGGGSWGGGGGSSGSMPSPPFGGVGQRLGGGGGGPAVASAAAAIAAAAAYDAHDAEEEEERHLQLALQASLSEYAASPARSSASHRSCGGALPGSGGTSSHAPIVLDDSEEEDDETKPDVVEQEAPGVMPSPVHRDPAASLGGSGAKKRARDGDGEEKEEGVRDAERMRQARLARFGGA